MTVSDQAKPPAGDAPLDEARIEALLHTGWIGRHCICLPHAVSTNDEAIRLARQGCPDGTVVLADAQSAGRGRQGRSWASPAGANLYLSIVLRPPWRANEVPPLSLVVALALARGLGEVLPRPPTLKWPNDLLCCDRKLAGILLEMSSDADRVAHLVVGIGVNVNQRCFADPIDQIATSICLQTGQRVDRARVLARLLGELELHVERLYRGEKAALLREWEQMADWIGREVEVQVDQTRVCGVAQGLADDGALLLRDAAGETQRVVAGDLFLF